MAFASSRIGAQEVIIKPCDLCEDDEDVNWFCKNCFQNLCEKCKKMHPKIVSFKDHHLVSILEGLAITKENVSNLCQDHSEPFSFFCRQCEQNICSKCLSMNHRKHDLVALRVFEAELQNKLQEALKGKENEMKEIKGNLDAFVQYEQDCNKILNETYATIDERRKALQSAVGKECEEMKERMRNATDQRLKKVQENKRKVQVNLNAYDEKIQTTKQRLQLQTAATINKFVKSSISSFQSLKPLSYPVPKLSTFIVGNTNKEHIQEMIGTEGVSEQHGKLEHKEKSVRQQLRIIRMFELEMQRYLYCICTCSDGNIWIGGMGCVYKMSSDCSAVLHKVEYLSYISPFHENLSIACLQSGDPLVSQYEVHYINKVIEDRTLTFRDLNPKWGHEIYVTNQDEVIISAGQNSKGQTDWSLVIFSNEGKFLNGIKVSKTLSSFCIGNDGNLIISDKESSCLTFIDRNGAVLKEIQTTTPGLQRLACDRDGNILGVLNGGKAVGLISQDGRVERSFTVQCDKSIDDFCIDRENHLLILVDK